MSQIFDPPNLANTAWVFGRLNVWQEELLGPGPGRPLVRFEEFSPKHVAEATWTFRLQAWAGVG